MKNVGRGIQVAVVLGAAAFAAPTTVTQLQARIALTATRADLTAWVPTVHVNDGAPVPVRLVANLAVNLAERRIGYGTAKRAPTHAPAHALDAQVFEANRIELAHQVRGELMLRVTAQVTDSGMQPSDTRARTPLPV